MPLDHFVPQVHLRRFLDPALGNRTNAIRKSNLASFTTRPRDVCRVEDGSTNAYLQEPRAVEEFLRRVEPVYNEAVESFRDGVPSVDSIMSISGLMSYIMTCSPTGRRLNVEPLRAIVENTARMLDATGEIDRPPETLAAQNLTELLDTGRVRINIDADYPNAISVGNLIQNVSTFGNSKWDILIIDDDQLRFVTSDHPVCIAPSPDPRVMSRVMPLSTDVAIIMTPDYDLRGAPIDLAFPNFRYRKRAIRREFVNEINSLISKCAEDLVFSGRNDEEFRSLVTDNRNYRLESRINHLPVANGIVTAATTVIASLDRN